MLKGIYPVLLCVLAACDVGPTPSSPDGPTSSINKPAKPLPMPSRAEGLYGQADKIFDGDSFIFRANDGRRLEVRILGIDAPERGQDHATASRDALRRLLARETRLEVQDVDRYGRSLAHVYVADSNESVAEAMISGGHAWVYKKYRGDADPMKLESAARQQRLGLWQDRYRNDPIPPWTWRAQKKQRHGR